MSTKYKFMIEGLAYLDNLEKCLEEYIEGLDKRGFMLVEKTVSMGVTSVLVMIEYCEKYKEETKPAEINEDQMTIEDAIDSTSDLTEGSFVSVDVEQDDSDEYCEKKPRRKRK